MHELSLFTGVGGGALGSKLLGWNTIGYVEFNDYCQRVISQRIKDGILDHAPIFSDVRAFIGEGYADAYQGMVDVVTAGFPCQPFSVAGQRKGEDDERNMWPQTIECIRRIKPRYFFGENVPGLLNCGYFPEILGSLAEAGFDARWIVLGADDVGAPHRRKRLWILADSDSELRRGGGAVGSGGTDAIGRVHPSEEKQTGQHVWGEAIGRGSVRGKSERQPPGPWPTEPRLGRVVPHGLANRNERLKAIGNGQVSRVFATAWEILSNGETVTIELV